MGFRYFEIVFGLIVSGSALLTAPPDVPPPTAPPVTKPLAPGLPVTPAPLGNPLVGEYTIISGEEAGQRIPAERLKDSLVQITPERIVGTQKDKKEIFSCLYVVDFDVRPWTIRMKSANPEADSRGLVKKEGDTLTLVYALPGGETPKEFKAGEKQHLFVMKMLKMETKSESGNVPEK